MLISCAKSLRWDSSIVSLKQYGKIKRFTWKVVEHNNLRLIEARVPVMGSAESSGTIYKRYERLY